jgi:hypothetical protein
MTTPTPSPLPEELERLIDNLANADNGLAPQFDERDALVEGIRAYVTEREEATSEQDALVERWTAPPSDWPGYVA